MSDLFGEMKLTRSDIRGAAVICVVLIAIAVIVALTRHHSRQEVVSELNEEVAAPDNTIVIKEFDPNNVELAELLSFGLSKYEALSIIRYRASGRVFNIKEELIACYGISDSLYFALEPYIVIGEEFRYKPREKTYSTSTNYTQKPQRRQSVAPRLAPSPFLIDTVTARYLTAIGALSPKQAEVFERWRDMSGIRSLDELKACYTVSDSIANWLAQYAIFTPKTAEVEPIKQESAQRLPTELNTADSAALDAIYGIGAKTAMAIIDYRERLGGFYSKEQLAEIEIITEGNYEKIITQISLDNSNISKININFATANELSAHPYFTNLKIRRLLKFRELKGGYRTLEELIENKIFTTKEAQQVRPYLHFEVIDPL